MMKLRQLFLFTLLLSCGTFSAYSQDPFFRKIELPGNASDYNILSLCEDSRKVIWIGTNNGLLKFNGFSFEQVELPDSLKGQQINVIASFNKTNIIAGTNSGKLIVVSNESARLFTIDSLKINSPISSIIQQDDGAIWIATKGEGLYLFRDKQVSRFSTETGFADDYIYTMTIDNNNQLWAGTDAGLSYCSLGEDSISFRNIHVANGLPDNIVRCIIKGPGNTIGIGMEEKGFCMYDIINKEFIQNDYFRNWTGGVVMSMILLENEFWIGTGKSGITDYEFRGKNRIRVFYGSDDFPGPYINCILNDHEGNVWVSNGKEVYFSTGENIEFTRTIGDYKLGNINTILTDKSENIWFNSDEGLFCYEQYDNDRWDLKRPLKGTPYETFQVISLYEDTLGYVWIGTFDQGVLRLNPRDGKIVRFEESNGLKNLNILSIDGIDDEIWLATLGGVFRTEIAGKNIDDVTDFTGYTEENGLGNNFIYQVYIDSKKRVWFATDGEGVTCFDNGSFINYSVGEGLKSRVIYSITEDHNGNMWMSSVNDGLYKFDGKKFTNYSFGDGLSDLNISGISTDANGNLIILNKKGVDVIDPDNFRVLSYGREVGLEDIDPDLNSFDVDLHGDIFAGIKDGIVRLSFEKSASAKAPLIILDRVLCFLENTDTNSVKKFDYDRNYLTFNYFSVWYADPSKVRYQYKLSGYSNEWITTSDRVATFPNLSPGEYVFYVRASANQNFDNVPVVTYSFTIKLPFWKAPWFVLLVSLALIGMFYAYINFRDNRVKSLEKLNRERIESQFEVLKNQVNPHFLFNSFNTLISVIENDKEKAVDYVMRLSDFFRSILAVREIDLISLREELELVGNYIFLQQKRYGGNFIVDVSIPEVLIEECMIPPLSLQILLENCLKHNAVSSESPLKCEIYTEDDTSLIVRNNINPKFEKDPSTGIGLQNVRSRFRIITGNKIDVQEKDGYFVVRLPLIRTSK